MLFNNRAIRELAGRLQSASRLAIGMAGVMTRQPELGACYFQSPASVFFCQGHESKDPKDTGH